MINRAPEISAATESLGIKPINLTTKLKLIIAANLERIWIFFKRAIYKIGKILYSIALVKRIVDLAYEAKVAQYQASLPKLDTEDQIILEALQKTGTYSITIEDLQLESTESFLRKTRDLVNYLKNIPSANKNSIDLEQDKFTDHPEIFLWGIEPRILDIIEHYIGLPLYYQGYALRRDIVTDTSTDAESVRAWHLDAEDRAMIKVIIYLNDVGLDGGHYQYVSKDLTEEAIKKINYNSGYLSDQKMVHVIPERYWNGCIGKLGTVIFTDPSKVFHRAKPPEKEDRFSISFCYTSNKPKYYWGTTRFPKNLSEIRNKLNEKQRNVLSNKNKLFGIKLGRSRYSSK